LGLRAGVAASRLLWRYCRRLSNAFRRAEFLWHAHTFTIEKKAKEGGVMRVAVFSTKPYVKEFLTAANRDFGHELVFFEARLSPETTVLAQGFPAVCAFVNDQLSAEVLADLHKRGVRLIALRCAGVNHVDLAAAAQLGLTVMNVPAYSPYSIAEHAVGLILALNRKLNRAYNRVRDGNFSLDGLMGFDLHGRTAGIVGTGKIGECVARILHGFGCRLLAHDPRPNPEVEALGARYAPLAEIHRESDLITLHCPLIPATRHLVNAACIREMKRGVMLINTSRGGLVDAAAVIEGLKSGQIGYLGLDVYEEEAELFFEDLSNYVLQDDVFARLQTFPNVIITGHQAFFTQDAVAQISQATLQNVRDFEQRRASKRTVILDRFKK
jgi:D-lactate dehydrogenase